jgi:lysophospholipase L1-like esterase
VGRCDRRDPAAVRFDWPMSGVRFKVKAQSLAVLLKDGANDWDVLVDGKPGPVLVTQPGVERYEVKLPGKPCVVELLKRTEGSFGSAAFLGLDLPKGAELLALPAAPARRLLVLGDSWTAGYGVEAVTKTCASLRPWANARLAFPALAARAFGAEARMLAVSGKGITRYYGSPKAEEADKYPAYFKRTLSSVPAEDWTPDGWVPDAFVVHLGLNDFSTEPAPTAEAWAKAYAAFLKTVRGAHPKAPLFLCLTEGWPYKMKELYMAQAEAAKLGIEANVVGLPAVSPDAMGCDWHPDRRSQELLAKPLIQALERELEWTPLP